MQTRSLLFAVTLCTLCACQDDLTEQKATWEAATSAWATKLEATKKGHEALVTKMKAVPELETEALKEEKADFEKRVATGAAAIEASEKAIAEAKTTMDRLMSQGKRVPVEVALANTKSSVDGILARAESFVTAANTDLDMLRSKMESVRKAGEAATARAAAWAAEMKKKGASVMVEGVVFDGEKLEPAKSKDGVAGLAVALKSCPELKVELAVKAAGEAADLGSKRAEALKAQLTAEGVSAGTLAKVTGSTAKDAEEAVSVTVTSPCK